MAARQTALEQPSAPASVMFGFAPEPGEIHMPIPILSKAEAGNSLSSHVSALLALLPNLAIHEP